MRYKNIEFRQLCGDRPAELVAWNQEDTLAGEFCYTLLWWRKDNEGYYIEFVGDRPLQHEDQESLFKMMKYGQSVLTAQYRLMEY